MQKSLFESKKGQALGVKAVMITLVTAGIIALVGVLIFSKVSGSIDQTGFSADENSTVSTIRTTVLDSFELAVIALIVLAAVAILAVLFVFGGR